LNEGQRNLNDGQQQRPSFAEGFPRVPELDALVEAFARGNYAQVRREGRKLTRLAADDGVRRAARTLVERTEADPLSLALLGLAGALLIVTAAWWIAHGRPPPVSAPRTEHVR
jgi:hypothetical protein